MNERELDEAANLLFQKVKITIATIIIKSTPENLNVKNYAAMFQDKFRKHASRVNLHLEKKLFYEQLLLLLPAFRISSSQELGDRSEPMEVDAEEDAPAAALQTKLYTWTMSETEQFYTNTIKSLAQFLDAVTTAEVLSNGSEMISRGEVVDLLLLLSCEESSLAVSAQLGLGQPNERFASISSNLLKYAMKSVDVVRVTSECVATIVGLVRKFLKNVNAKFVNRESILAVKYANEVLLKQYTHLAHNRHSGSFIVEFVDESTRDFLARSANQSACHCWYTMFGCWRQRETTCATAINALFGTLVKVSESKAAAAAFAQLPADGGGEHILDALKRMLSAYVKLCWPETASLPSQSRVRGMDNSEQSRKPAAKFRRADISHWEKMLRNVILDCISKKQPIIQNSWTCLKIIMLLKCRLRAENDEPRSHEIVSK